MSRSSWAVVLPEAVAAISLASTFAASMPAERRAFRTEMYSSLYVRGMIFPLS